jgi:hypothetical protein
MLLKPLQLLSRLLLKQLPLIASNDAAAVSAAAFDNIAAG